MTTMTSSHSPRRVTAVALVGSLLLALVGAKPAQAALPGKNGNIVAYVAKDSSGNFQIYTIPPDGNGSPKQITSGATDHLEPNWGVAVQHEGQHQHNNKGHHGKKRHGGGGASQG